MAVDEERPSKIRKISHADQHDGGTEDHESDGTLNSQEIIVSDGSDREDDNQDGGVDTSVKSAGPVENGSANAMSKNQLKKLRKRQEWEAGRELRKLKRKEKTKEKKDRKRAAMEERRAAGDFDRPQPRKPQNPIRLPVTFIIDCGYDDLMVEKERISLGSQLTRAYADNSRAVYQAHLIISSWGGLLKQRFDTTLNGHYKHWKGVRFLEEDFVEAAQKAEGWMAHPKHNRLAGVFSKYATPNCQQEAPVPSAANEETPNYNNDIPPPSENPIPARPDTTTAAHNTDHTTPPETSSKGEVIYLSSDAQETLTELKPHSTYIIGGLVDKNRHKGICHKTAWQKGIKTAKLPIGEYLEMSTRSVLATNHVNEIMLRWLECGDWGEAFMRVIPKRKGGRLRGEGGGEGDGEGENDGGDAGEAERDAGDEAAESGAVATEST